MSGKKREVLVPHKLRVVEDRRAGMDGFLEEQAFEPRLHKLELSFRNMPTVCKMYVVVIWGRTSIWQ